MIVDTNVQNIVTVTIYFSVNKVIKTIGMFHVIYKMDLLLFLNVFLKLQTKVYIFMSLLDSLCYLRPFRTVVMITVQSLENCLYKIIGSA